MTTTIAEPPQSILQGVPQEQPQISPRPGDSLPDIAPDAPHPPAPAANTHEAETRAQKKERKKRLYALSKTFGHIPDVPIFTHWLKRVDCSDSAVHRSTMAGICGNSTDGAYSVSLSDKYKDNEDGGDVIIYTGAGGRLRWTNTTPPKRIRVGPQTENQSWEHPSNKALIVSFLTGNPLRVIRSYRSTSEYAPLKGYRYDGLYKVGAYWTAKGRNGKDICRCRLERLPDQPPIPVRQITMPASRRRRERLVSGFTSNPSWISSYTNPNDCPRETSDTSPNQPNELAGSNPQMTRDTEETPNQQHKQDMSEISTDVDFDMGELEVDVKHPLPQPSRPRSSPKLGAMTRYRWDSRTNQLIRIPAVDAAPDSVVPAEEDRVADDATLVQSEDGHANGRETEFYSDLGDTDEA